jgi:REP element-mobilizing transposase RayT
LGRVINAFKGAVTRHIRRLPDADPSTKIWQGRYHDHIIRDVNSLNAIRQYIATNPSRWQDDSLYG